MMVIMINIPHGYNNGGAKLAMFAPSITSHCYECNHLIGDKSMENWKYEINNKKYRIRIRKLTPKECWRLMGFSDEDFRKAEAVCSNSRLYMQAGNSIVVPVLEAIFKNMKPISKETNMDGEQK